MAIDIDWVGGETNPYRILVPRADMSISQVSPEIRELDVDDLRGWLKDLEAAAEGMMWPDTHEHTGERTLAGVTYGREVQILAPYVLEFEDAQYGVSVIGGNSNLLDVKVANQVSLLTNNSAGIVVAASTVTAQDVWEYDVSAVSDPGAGSVITAIKNLVNAIMGLV